MPNVKAEQLEQIAFHLFYAAGTPEKNARIVAQHLVESNLTGHDSHGFIRVIQYLRQIKEGMIIPAAKPEIVSESPGTAQVDGHYGFGPVVATFSAEVAIDKAKKQGVSSVAVRNLSHLGRLGAYGEMAAHAGCAAILYCSTGGKSIYQAPFGGAQGKLGTNPFAMVVPSEKEGRILSDFATSVAAEGKIRVYRARGHKLPDGWILDKAGRPSNNPDDFYAGGAVLPVGSSVGYKGFCMAFMTEVFSGVLARNGSPSHPNKHFSNGAFILAIDIERFAPLAAFKSEVSDLVGYIKNTPPAEGFESVLAPGEKESKIRRERVKSGVEIEDETWNQVMALIKDYGVAEKLGKIP